MDVFLESPIPVLLAGLIVASALGVVYLNSRKRGLLVAMGVVLVAVVAGIALERSIKTDQEQIADTLDQLASALQADGLADNSADAVIDRVLRVISESPDAARTRSLAETNLRRAKITRASYSNLRVKINKLSLPPSAEIQFDASISGEGRPPLDNVVAYHTYPLEFAVKMVYESHSSSVGPRWLIGERLRWRLRTFGQEADPGRFGFDTGDLEEPLR